jgi:aryl-alcohol dehydrogenase-like predicted oxidoreductase
MPRDDALAVMRAARDAGIDFLDDARYDDRTGTAPLPTGYSEVLFGKLFRDAGWRRDEVVVANKAWLEFWPDQSAAAEVEASLERMGFDFLDLVYSAPPPDGYAVTDLVADMDALVRRGTTRSWGFLNCSATVLREACVAARMGEQAMPVAVQLPYSVVSRDWVESDEMVAVLDEFGVSVVASATLAGGALTGKYASVGATGRLAGALDGPRTRAAVAAGEELSVSGRAIGASAAQLAISFALLNPRVASVLLGATSPAQVEENVAAVGVFDRLEPHTRDAVLAIGSAP